MAQAAGQGRLPEQGSAKEYSIEKGNPVHAKHIGEYQFTSQQRQHKAAEIDRTDVIAKGQQEPRLLSVDLTALIELSRDSGSHRETAEETYEDPVVYFRSTAQQRL